MHQLFNMSDLGLLSSYLWIEVKQREGVITLCQSTYAEKVLEQACMKDCNPSHTTMEHRLQLIKGDTGGGIDVTKYRSVVGSLRYLCNTRPDITHAVGIVSRHMEAPGAPHWAAVKQILRYVRGTSGYGCCYKRTMEEAELVGYSDSDLAGEHEWHGVLGSNSVSWQSLK